jgi:hypothetical protein
MGMTSTPRFPAASSLLLAVFLASPATAQDPPTFRASVGGHDAVAQVAAADAELAEAASQAALAALEARAGDEAAGPAVDAAVAAARAAGVGAVLVSWRGVTAAGDPPPGAPGWFVNAGFGTPGYRLYMELLANAGLAQSSAPDEPLKIAVLARSAAEAERLAHAAREAGRKKARVLVDEAGARLILEDTRYRPLFDGRSLAGWTTVGGRYDGDATWSVERSAILGSAGPDGAGGLLYTEEEFTSYAVEMDVEIDEPFDSGVFVHMVPPERGLKGVQVTLDNRPDGEIGALYADGYREHRPEGKELFRQGAPNHVEVRVTGFEPRIEAWLNGVPVCDHQLPPAGFAARGRIGLQVHDGSSGSVRFRNVRIRELPVFGTKQRAKDGWEPLFDGESLAGWEPHGVQAGFRVEDGVLVLPARGDGFLATTADYEDFALRLDFKAARMANGGLFLRAARDGSNPAFSGCEVQILDDLHWEEVTGTTLKPWQLTGSLYGAVPAGEKLLRPPGEWNTYELLYRGSRLAVALNGRLLYDVDTHALEPQSGAPFAERARKGFIGLQVHSGAVEGDASLWLRDLLVRRL